MIKRTESAAASIKPTSKTKATVNVNKASASSSKTDKLIAALSQSNGATIEELTNTTGWQKHWSAA